MISEFESYTGLTYTDADFTTAAATIGAQTGLSTFVCLASFLLILFLSPPSRFFAAWTPPDRRPPSDLPGRRRCSSCSPPCCSSRRSRTTSGSPRRPRRSSTAVLAALALWFVALTAALRLRLLDRVLGLNELP